MTVTARTTGETNVDINQDIENKTAQIKLTDPFFDIKRVIVELKLAGYKDINIIETDNFLKKQKGNLGNIM